MVLHAISGTHATSFQAFTGLRRGSATLFQQTATPALLPAELAFLIPFGIAPAVLLTAAALAVEQGIEPDVALLANGTISEIFFYRCLAHHLGAAFLDGEAGLGAGARYPQSIHVGLAPLAGDRGPRWLAAPRGKMLALLLARAQAGENLGTELAITTPTRMSCCVHERRLRSCAKQVLAWQISIQAFRRKMARVRCNALERC